MGKQSKESPKMVNNVDLGEAVKHIKWADYMLGQDARKMFGL